MILKRLLPVLFGLALTLGVSAQGICAILCAADLCPTCKAPAKVEKPSCCAPADEPVRCEQCCEKQAKIAADSGTHQAHLAKAYDTGSVAFILPAPAPTVQPIEPIVCAPRIWHDDFWPPGIEFSASAPRAPPVSGS